MEKQIRILKKGQDDHNLRYWLLLSTKERMSELENIRTHINQINMELDKDFKEFIALPRKNKPHGCKTLLMRNS